MYTIKERMLIGPFQVDQVLPQGKGGMAEVCVAHINGEDKHNRVALKISRVDDSAGEVYIQALRAESEILKQLGHQNIVRILPLPIASKYDPYMACAYDLRGSPWYYAMEYLQGKPLSGYIRGSKGLPEKVAVTIVLSIANALAYMHQKGFAHLDVKPENVVFRHNLDANQIIEPVLIDFGTTAKFKDTQMDRGSLAYSPAERLYQMKGEVAAEVHVDTTKVDVYALGVLFYETLSGRLPFGGFTEKGLTSAIKNHAMTPIRSVCKDISVDSEALVNKMLSLKPADRPDLPYIITQLSRMQRLDGPLPFSIPYRR